MPEADLVGYWDHAMIDRWVSVRNLWRSRPIASVTRGFIGEITPDTEQDLHAFLDWLLTARRSVDFKLVTSNHVARLYSNDLEFLTSAASLPYVNSVEYSQVALDRPRDTIRLKTANHRYRSYFRSIKFTDAQKRNLVNFLNNSQQEIRISPGLARWAEFDYYHTYDYFFIDHNDMSWLTMLSLIRGGVIRKTMEIIADK